jgi:hypothetical protein
VDDRLSSGTIRRSVSDTEGSEATTFEPPRKVAVTCQRYVRPRRKGRLGRHTVFRSEGLR